MELATIDTASWGERNLSSLKLGNLTGTYEADIDDMIIGGFAAGKNKVSPARKSWDKFSHLRDLNFDTIDADVEVLLSSAHLSSTPTSCETDLHLLSASA